MFVDNVIIYVKKVERNLQKILELISYYSKVAGYILIHKSQSLSYIAAMNKWNLKLKTI